MRYRITHVFQHQDRITGDNTDLATDTFEVDSWEDISTVVDSMILHTGIGYTVSITVDLVA